MNPAQVTTAPVGTSPAAPAAATVMKGLHGPHMHTPRPRRALRSIQAKREQRLAAWKRDGDYA